MKNIVGGIEDLVGNTPIMKLNRMFPGFEIYAKLEYYNPTLSIKDRAAFHMVAKKIARGEVKKGDYIIEATSGNTGLGLCVAAMVHGLKFIAVLFDDVSPEKISMLKKYGALVLMCDGTVPSNEKGGYVWTAREIASRFPNVHFMNQFGNEDNPDAHIVSTGPEIWDSLGSSIDLFVNTVGTGGTITGISSYLKSRKHEIRTIAVEPVGGIYRDYFWGNEMTFQDHLIHSISDNFISPNFKKRYIDDVVQVADEESFSCCLELMRTEGLCVGTSAGCTIAALKSLIASGVISKDTVTVCTLADSGLKYCDSLLNDNYLRTHGFSCDSRSVQDENQSKVVMLLEEYGIDVEVVR